MDTTFNPGEPDRHTIQKSIRIKIETPDKELSKYQVYENKKENKIIVKSALRNPHPLVKQSLPKLTSKSTTHYGQHPRGYNCLDIDVGKNNLHQAMLIVDALIKALDERGHTVYIKSGYNDNTYVTILSEKITFGILESSKKVLKSNSIKEEKNDYFYKPYEYVPSGQLTLRIKEYHAGQKSISDGKTQQLENCINRFILLLIESAEIKKADRLEREKWEKEWREKERRVEEERIRKENEEKKVKQLFDDALTWNHCNLV